MKYILFLFFLATNTYAQEKIIHAALEFPPYWKSDGNKVIGSHAELSNRIYKEANLDVKLQIFPYARIIKQRVPKAVAIMAYGSNEETNKLFLFPVPKTNIFLRAYSLQDFEQNIKFNVEGKKIAVKRGFPLGKYTFILKDSSVEIFPVEREEQAIKLLVKKRVDYILTLDDPMSTALERVKPDVKIYKKKLDTLEGWPIVILKSHPKANQLFKKIKAAYERLTDKNIIIHDGDVLRLKK